MSSLEFSFGSLGKGSLFANELHKIFVLGVVNHLDGGSFEDVLALVVHDHFVEFPLLLLKTKTVNSINLNPLGYFSSFLGNIFGRVFSFVV